MTIQNSDEPLTPAGRMFVEPKMEQIINCSIAAENPFDINAIKTQLQSSYLTKHPRFSSLMIKTPNGRQIWRKTKVNIDQHLIIHNESLSNDAKVSDDDAINDYVADLCVSTPLPVDKPLWEIHLFMKHKTAVCRFHHALGDGISLMSVLMSCCRRKNDPDEFPSIGGVGKSKGREWSFWGFLKVVWFTFVYMMEFMMRIFWMKDEKTVLSGGDGVELWPRRLATARFLIEDMKVVKEAVKDATINDVLFGIISSGFSRYLEIRSSEGKCHALREGLQLTGLAMVNLRPQSGLQDISKLMNSTSGTRWGNKFGMLLLPIFYHKRGSDPIVYLRRAKAMIDKKKLSLEAPFSYKLGNLIMSVFGPKLASILNYRIVCNTTFTISNVMGPREAITFGGNPVKSIRVTTSSLPHAITMHMLSYAGVADMQILAAKDIIPDPKVLAKCLEDALIEMKVSAEEVKRS